MNRSEILEDIRDRIGEENLFEGNLFEEGECSVDLTGVSENDRVVVDLDKKFPGGRWRQKQCECVLFYFDDVANFVVVPIELKGGKNTEVTKAVEQLKSGANFAAIYTPCNCKSVCQPVLFHKRPLSTAEYRQLKKPKSKIFFRGEPFEIKTARCGNKLADVLPRIH